MFSKEHIDRYAKALQRRIELEIWSELCRAGHFPPAYGTTAYKPEKPATLGTVRVPLHRISNVIP